MHHFIFKILLGEITWEMMKVKHYVNISKWLQNIKFEKKTISLTNCITYMKTVNVLYNFAVYSI